MSLFFYSPRVLEPEAMISRDEARAYDRLTVKYLDILHKGFVETVLNGGVRHGTVLEVGTGTGRIATQLAKYGTDLKLLGLDLSSDMLAVAAENAVAAGVEARVSFLIGDAKRLPFPTASLDAVISHNMLHHLPDPLGMVEEIFRVAKPSAAVFIRDLVRPPDSLIGCHAAVFGLSYDPVMKRQYVDSMRAALTWQEWKDAATRFASTGASLCRQFLTHATLQRPIRSGPVNRLNVPGTITGSFARRLYVS